MAGGMHGPPTWDVSRKDGPGRDHFTSWRARGSKNMLFFSDYYAFHKKVLNGRGALDKILRGRAEQIANELRISGASHQSETIVDDYFKSIKVRRVLKGGKDGDRTVYHIYSRQSTGSGTKAANNTFAVMNKRYAFTEKEWIKQRQTRNGTPFRGPWVESILGKTV